MRRRRPSPDGAASARRLAREQRLAARAEIITAELLPGAPSKFHNKRCTYRGMTFDSLGEAEYAWKLDLLVEAGEIVYWEQPKPIVLVDAYRARDRITYKPDFWIIPADRPGNLSADSYAYSYYVDYKGGRVTETAAWKLKVKLWRQKVPFELRVAYKHGEEKTVATGEIDEAHRAF